MRGRDRAKMVERMKQFRKCSRTIHEVVIFEETMS
jgi:hypothetical protein